MPSSPRTSKDPPGMRILGLGLGESGVFEKTKAMEQELQEFFAKKAVATGTGVMDTSTMPLGETIARRGTSKSKTDRDDASCSTELGSGSSCSSASAAAGGAGANLNVLQQDELRIGNLAAAPSFQFFNREASVDELEKQVAAMKSNVSTPLKRAVSGVDLLEGPHASADRHGSSSKTLTGQEPSNNGDYVRGSAAPVPGGSGGTANPSAGRFSWMASPIYAAGFRPPMRGGASTAGTPMIGSKASADHLLAPPSSDDLFGQKRSFSVVRAPLNNANVTPTGGRDSTSRMLLRDGMNAVSGGPLSTPSAVSARALEEFYAVSAPRQSWKYVGASAALLPEREDEDPVLPLPGEEPLLTLRKEVARMPRSLFPDVVAFMEAERTPSESSVANHLSCTPSMLGNEVPTEGDVLSSSASPFGRGNRQQVKLETYQNADRRLRGIYHDRKMKGSTSSLFRYSAKPGDGDGDYFLETATQGIEQSSEQGDTEEGLETRSAENLRIPILGGQLCHEPWREENIDLLSPAKLLFPVREPRLAASERHYNTSSIDDSTSASSKGATEKRGWWETRPRGAVKPFRLEPPVRLAQRPLYEVTKSEQQAVQEALQRRLEAERLRKAVLEEENAKPKVDPDSMVLSAFHCRSYLSASSYLTRPPGRATSVPPPAKSAASTRDRSSGSEWTIAARHAQKFGEQSKLVGAYTEERRKLLETLDVHKPPPGSRKGLQHRAKPSSEMGQRLARESSYDIFMRNLNRVSEKKAQRASSVFVRDPSGAGFQVARTGDRDPLTLSGAFRDSQRWDIPSYSRQTQLLQQ
ncbi:unnamed protein product [Amoebophrya sp. A25]|nr:unnamed protein product [Amoebophrya sp. A25]|eukprot:GSA25T00023649001.1